MNYYEGDNIGGLHKVEIVPIMDISSFYPLTLRQGSTWLNIPIKSGKLLLKSADTENGIVHTYTVKFSLQRMRDEVDDALTPYIGQVGILKVTDMNLRQYIVGLPGIPVKLSMEGDTGQQYINENGTEFNAVVEQPIKAIKP